MIERLPRHKRNIALLVLGILVVWFAWSIRSVLNPLLLGYILAAIVQPVVRRLVKRGLKRRTAVVVVFASAALATLLVGLGLFVQLRSLVLDLGRAGAARAELVATNEGGSESAARDESGADAPRAAAPPNSGGSVAEVAPPQVGADASDANVPEAPEESAGTSGSEEDDTAPIAALLARTEHYLQDLLGLDDDAFDEITATIADLTGQEPGSVTSAAAAAGQRMATGLWASLRRFFGAVSGLTTLALLVPLYAFFWMFEMDAMHRWIRGHIPVRERTRTSRLAAKMGEILSRFFRGRLTICLIKGALVTVLLLAVGVRYSLLLGMLAGILSLVPFVGSLVAFALGAVVAAASWDGWVAGVLIAAVVYGAAELIEGYVLMPRILGDSLGLSEVAVLFAVTAGGAALGLFGVLAALPIAAAIKVVFREYVDPALTQWAEEESTPAPP
ncbi:MAG: AI-2E family transporter [Planctomycetota bacterium]